MTVRKSKPPLKSSVGRRDFIRTTALAAGALGTLRVTNAKVVDSGKGTASESKEAIKFMRQRAFNENYEGAHLNRVAFPMGGMGAGMICLEGTGALSHFSLRHRPDLMNEPCVFAAISVKGVRNKARVLEGPVPEWKLFPNFRFDSESAAVWGLPRFNKASFKARFPFGIVTLSDHELPLRVKIIGWSPFEPGDADNASLPVAGLEYTFINRTTRLIEAVFSFNSMNFMAAAGIPGTEKTFIDEIHTTPGGFILHGTGGRNSPWDEGSLACWVNDPVVKVNYAWFRGSTFGGSHDSLEMAWRDVEEAACYDRVSVSGRPSAPGASLFVPLALAPGATKTIILHLAWYVPRSNLNRPGGSVNLSSDPNIQDNYQPWYAGRFANIAEVIAYWGQRYTELKEKTARFSRCFYSSTLPPEVIEAVAANLTILKSTTLLRQIDGSLWGWEGSFDNMGFCEGSCTHVWNYAQAVPHLFPILERSLRETEFRTNQDERGHQTFRSALPIRIPPHDFLAAADGQLGGIMKVYRDWRISSDTEWLRDLWPKIRASLEYCIRTWDPRHRGWLEEPHHNTYDVEFWGPDSMCTSIYLGALKAAVLMGRALGEDIATYTELIEKGAHRCETDLFNGEYFFQNVTWRNLSARFPPDTGQEGLTGPYTAEALALAEREGPRYQYGNGCLSDGVLGSWMALVCGVGSVLDSRKVTRHLQAVYKYNLKRDLSTTADAGRAIFACGAEGGLLVCSWPKGNRLSLPLFYSSEVWTGIEYQVASHLIMMEQQTAGLDIVRTCRSRYDGRVRNPFDEYEAGHWYSRAMSSYALLQALSGARYDAVDKVLHVQPAVKGDFQSFLAAATGYGTVGVKNGKPFLRVAAGTIPITEIKYKPTS